MTQHWKTALVTLMLGFATLAPVASARQIKNTYFTLHSKIQTKQGFHTISGQVTSVTINQAGQVISSQPLRNAPMYVLGPDTGHAPKNTDFRWFRTDNSGRYQVKVREFGRYRFSLDPGWAKSHGLRTLEMRGGQIFIQHNTELNALQGKVVGAHPSGYKIHEKVTAFDERGKPVVVPGVVVYIHGPLPLTAHTPHVMLSVRTDKQGYFSAHVKYPGSYEASLDPGSVRHMGAYRWTPNSYRILVE